MPIRFRCVYCDKLLGIARRKAGAVVNCPQCNQPLIVPTPEPEPTAAATGASAPPPTKPGKLFERDDFDAMLQGDATLRTPEGERRRSRNDRPASSAPLPPKPFPVERSLPAPDDREPAFAPRPVVQPGIVLSTGMLILMIVGVLVLMGIAFGGGIVVGRMLH
jgi:phage FluMu protein Com